MVVKDASLYLNNKFSFYFRAMTSRKDSAHSLVIDPYYSPMDVIRW